MAHNITFSPDAWADYLYWQSEDKKTLKRINKLLQELQRDGAVQGIGKAELLRFDNGLTHMHSLRFSRIPTAPWRRRAGKGQWR